MNYKIRVNNEAESKEVQGLLELLGFEKQVWGFFPRGKYFIFANANYYSRDSVINFSECDYRELTTQELLDLVVLNRNSIDDATHACDYPSGLGVKLSGVWYAYNYNEKKWELWVDDSEYKVRDLKPIAKVINCTFDEKPIGSAMKEYLDPRNGYKLIEAPESEALEPHASDWIEVPGGADTLAGDSSTRYTEAWSWRKRKYDYWRR